MLKRPNVVLCQCDQLRSFEVGCYGNRVVRTPHIDRLAAGGVRFDGGVTNHPLCTPARSALLTGQYARTCAGMLNNTHTNPPNPERERLRDATLPDVLRDAGYHTALIGKWHIDPQPQLVGFDEAVYPLIAHRHYGQTYFDETGRHWKVDEFGCDFERDRVREFLGRQRRGQPFFLHYNISPPHQPIGPGHMPEKYLRMYDRDAVPVRPNTVKDGQVARDPYWFKVYRSSDFFWYTLRGEAEHEEDRLPEGFDLRDLTALYYGAVTCVDDYVGQLMAMLSEAGLAGDTLVVFLSDHGDNLGSHGRFNKGTLNEEAIRVPIIVHWPGRVRRHEDREHVAQTIDIMPTVLDLLGLEVPGAVQGRSLAPVSRDPQAELPAGEAYMETGGQMIGVRTLTHLYAQGFDTEARRVKEQPVWLYDLSDDPLEQRNLAGTGAESKVEDALRRDLLEWDAATPWLDVPPLDCSEPWRAREIEEH